MQLTVSVPEPCVSGFDLAPLALATATLGRPQAPLPRNRARYSGCFRRPAGDWRTAASELRGTLHRAGVVRSLDAARLGPDRSPAAIVVAIPAKDETSSIGATLAALARSADSAPSQLAAVVFVNNSDDGTDDAVRRAAMALDLPIFLLQGELRAPHRQAGWARRIAMDFADRLCGPDGVILTTDADTSVCPAWAGALATQLAWSADLVFGDFAIDTPSAAVSALHAPAVVADRAALRAAAGPIAAHLRPVGGPATDRRRAPSLHGGGCQHRDTRRRLSPARRSAACAEERGSRPGKIRRARRRAYSLPRRRERHDHWTPGGSRPGRHGRDGSPSTPAERSVSGRTAQARRRSCLDVD